MFNELAFDLDSVLDLTIFDLQHLQAHLAQMTTLKPRTQRTILFELRSFYNYIASKTHKLGQSPFKGFVFPQVTSGTSTRIQPISQKALKVLFQNMQNLPEHVQLALEISVVTGARANSICQLTTEALYQSAEGYSVKIHYQKTADYRLARGKSPYVIHELPEVLAKKLLAYIRQTEPLRSQLDGPYIFVYRSKSHRKNTQQKPFVLQAETFSDELQKILDASVQYDANSEPMKAYFRNIRAAVGRALFASGASDKDVALKLGNSPTAAGTSYNTKPPSEDAEDYNRHYELTLGTVRAGIEARSSVVNIPRKAPREELFGLCHAQAPCTNPNDCKSCSQRIVCKRNKGRSENLEYIPRT